MSKAVVFIHGMFMTPRSWDGWVARFAKAGYATHAPAWPHHHLPPDEARQRHPDPEVGALELQQVVAACAQVVRSLAEPPVLVGHSMGGLVVQLLLQQGLGAAGVAIDSAPPKGVLHLSWPLLKSNWGVLSPFAQARQAYLPTVEEFGYAFAHTLSPEALRQVYDTYVVPESRLVGRSTTTDAARIDFEKPRPPLLLVAGELDHIVPAALNQKNHARYGAAAGVTEFHQFPGRTHSICLQQGWEEVADFALGWLAAKTAQ